MRTSIMLWHVNSKLSKLDLKKKLTDSLAFRNAMTYDKGKSKKEHKVSF